MGNTVAQLIGGLFYASAKQLFTPHPLALHVVRGLPLGGHDICQTIESDVVASSGEVARNTELELSIPRFCIAIQRCEVGTPDDFDQFAVKARD